MKIYTKTGDSGDTGLVGGSRVEKDSVRIQAIGDVDELNAVVGLARCDANHTVLTGALERIQNLLFDLGAELATPPGSRFNNSTLSEEDVEHLETSIDVQVEALPELRNFILPAGSSLAARLHFARAVCRRAERSVLALHREEPVRDVARTFLNRLSDWLFVAARTANAAASVQDIEWRKTERTGVANP